MLDAAYLIPFKAKAWLDLAQRKTSGESVDSKNIRKHKNDVFRLLALLSQDTTVAVSQTVYEDIQEFIQAMSREDVDLKQLGIGRSKETILNDFMDIYIWEK